MEHTLLWQRLTHGFLPFDGGIGSEIYKRNFFVNRSFEQLNLVMPAEIEAIHRQYLDAGAEVLTTNTFGANSHKLAAFGLADQVTSICTAAVQVARRTIAAFDQESQKSPSTYAGNTPAASNAPTAVEVSTTEPRILVAGSIGPVGDTSNLSDAQMIAILREPAAALQSAGVDFLLFETLPSSRAVRCAVAVAQELQAPYMLSFALNRDAEGLETHEPLNAILAACPTDGHLPSAIGLNCGEGPEGMLSSLEKLLEVVHYPIVVRPNAGMPKAVDGRTIYMVTPEYFSTWTTRYLTLGARGVGGCCGIGPSHIADMVRSVRPLAAAHQRQLVATIRTEEVPLQPAVPVAEKSRLAGKLTRGEWVTTVEITPPQGFDLAPTILRARRCHIAGIDAINIPDGPRASSRISPIITAIEIQEKGGIEAVLHVCCRDRNLIGIQSDILGCMSRGIHNMLFITGDPPKLGDYPFSSGVFDVDSVGMVKIMYRLNRGVDIGGKPMKTPTSILVGVGADPSAVDPEYEFRRTCEKIDAGAEYITTQPVFDPTQLLHFVGRLRERRYTIPVIAGIWPLASYRNAEFMRNEVPGVVVPDSVMRRMGAAETKEAQREVGIAIAREAIAAIRDSVQGVQVSAPFGNVETAIEVLQA